MMSGIFIANVKTFQKLLSLGLFGRPSSWFLQLQYFNKASILTTDMEKFVEGLDWH